MFCVYVKVLTASSTGSAAAPDANVSAAAARIPPSSERACMEDLLSSRAPRMRPQRPARFEPCPTPPPDRGRHEAATLQRTVASLQRLGEARRAAVSLQPELAAVVDAHLDPGGSQAPPGFGVSVERQRQARSEREHVAG